MKEIQLSRGHVSLVDDDDYAAVAIYKWSFAANGYAVRAFVGADGIRRCILMHRQIMMPSGSLVVDHINGDTLDNRRNNLRVVSRSKNQTNRIVGRANSTGYRGVYKINRKGKPAFLAKAVEGGKEICLKSTYDLDEAIAARQRYEMENPDLYPVMNNARWKQG